MSSARLSIPWVTLAVFAVTLMLGLYFTFAAVQGDYGLFRRAEIISDAQKLEAELARIDALWNHRSEPSTPSDDALNDLESKLSDLDM